MAILEIRARHVDGTFENAQHLYWLYTNDAGEQYSFSGFPGDNGHFSMLYENILVVDSLYDAENDDFDTDGSHFTATNVFEGTDAQVEAKVDLMRAELTHINNGDNDYNLLN